jgi:hypothetical protein
MANPHTKNQKSNQICFELLRTRHADANTEEETFQEHNASAPLGGRGHNYG